ncbi:uncharacterized protein CLUP02_16567 [Colletotrichum lupini]|uniref:Uncharacterized protein n=1 Tax=Colletotrichum lupini TaxID=145971 RepID=A0A9Q8T865_9PEZI|nr:uncharacterized protein CLUP02_16567 [Colletotrichum lupini]UQC91033.1 hypothetical protein CLUP02_16567 [Colletotrichum lupini]
MIGALSWDQRDYVLASRFGSMAALRQRGQVAFWDVPGTWGGIFLYPRARATSSFLCNPCRDASATATATFFPYIDFNALLFSTRRARYRDFKAGKMAFGNMQACRMEAHRVPPECDPGVSRAKRPLAGRELQFLHCFVSTTAASWGKYPRICFNALVE